MFKSIQNEILPFLSSLFNELYDRGEIPSDWCKNIICPLYKGGPSTNPENYRGISLINSISKIFTGILTTRLQKWAEENSVIDESQAGFRKGTLPLITFSLYKQSYKNISVDRGVDFIVFLSTLGHVVQHSAFEIMGFAAKERNTRK